MVLRVGMHRHMALIQMCQNRLPGKLHRNLRFLRHQNRDRSPLRIVVLPGDMKDLCTDHLYHMCQNIRQTLRVILLVDIGNIFLLFPRSLGVTDIVNIKAKCFRQVVEAVQL